MQPDQFRELVLHYRFTGSDLETMRDMARDVGKVAVRTLSSDNCIVFSEFLRDIADHVEGRRAR